MYSTCTEYSVLRTLYSIGLPTWGPLPGAGGAAAPPQILEEKFSIYSAPPPDFGGFCSECFNSVIKFVELRE